MHFIRYNPHAFSIDSIKQCIHQKQCHKMLRERIQTTVFNDLFHIKYLFYDTIDNKPVIFDDPEYNESFKQCCDETHDNHVVSVLPESAIS